MAGSRPASTYEPRLHEIGKGEADGAAEEPEAGEGLGDQQQLRRAHAPVLHQQQHALHQPGQQRALALLEGGERPEDADETLGVGLAGARELAAEAHHQLAEPVARQDGLPLLGRQLHRRASQQVERDRPRRDAHGVVRPLDEVRDVLRLGEQHQLLLQHELRVLAAQVRRRAVPRRHDNNRECFRAWV